MSFTNSSVETSDCLSNFANNINFTNLPSSVKPTWTVLLVVNGIASPVTFIINLLIIWVVLEDESLRSKKSNLLLSALAFSDLLVSLAPQTIVTSMLAIFLQGIPVPCEFHKIASPITFIVWTLTLSSLMMVSVERYLAVEHPFFYSKITTKHVVLSAIVTCGMSVLVALFETSTLIQNSVGTKTYRAIVLAVFMLDVLSIIYCSGKVQLTAHRHMKNIIKQAAAVLDERTDEEKQDQKRRYQEYKHALNIGIIVLANIILYCPFITIMILKTAQSRPGDFRYIAIPIGMTCINLQSLANPFIMSLRLSFIRKALKKKVCKCLHAPDEL